MYYIKCNYAWTGKRKTAKIGKIYEVEDLITYPEFSCHTWKVLLNQTSFPKAFEIVLLEEIY